MAIPAPPARACSRGRQNRVRRKIDGPNLQPFELRSSDEANASRYAGMQRHDLIKADGEIGGSRAVVFVDELASDNLRLDPKP